LVGDSGIREVGIDKTRAGEVGPLRSAPLRSASSSSASLKFEPTNPSPPPPKIKRDARLRLAPLRSAPLKSAFPYACHPWSPPCTKNATQAVAGGSIRIPYSPRIPGDCLAKMPPGFCRYNVRIPYSSQTFTVLPTKYVGATFITAPGTSLRSLANVTLKALQNMQFCKERIRRRRGLWGCYWIPYPPRIFTVPLTTFYRTPCEFLPYRSRRITVRSTNFYRTAR
jgi:hypothetical protein